MYSRGRCTNFGDSTARAKAQSPLIRSNVPQMLADQPIRRCRCGQRVVGERVWIDTHERSDDPTADQHLAQQRQARRLVDHLLGYSAPPAIRQPDLDVRSRK
jgi:hypothetical protein